MNGHDDGWGHWYSVLVACAVIVVVLVAIIIALLVVSCKLSIMGVAL